MARADYENAKALYPSVSMGEADWLQVFHRNTDIMWAIIGDIYGAIKTEEEKAAGIHRMGRRPSRTATSLDDVYATVFPAQFSMDPFPVALSKLLAGRSQQQFAMKIPCNQTTISRLLSGRRQPDLVMLGRIAAAAKVSPFFFLEFRALWVANLVAKQLLAAPNMSITAIKRVRAGRLAMED